MRSLTIAQTGAGKSTNGRSNSTPLDLRRLAFQWLGWVAPEVAQRRALERFLTPPRPRAAPAKMPALEELSGDRFRVKMTTALGGKVESTELAVAVWGRGPAVYLVHGWGGRSVIAASCATRRSSAASSPLPPAVSSAG